MLGWWELYRATDYLTWNDLTRYSSHSNPLPFSVRKKFSFDDTDTRIIILMTKVPLHQKIMNLIVLEQA